MEPATVERIISATCRTITNHQHPKRRWTAHNASHNAFSSPLNFNKSHLSPQINPLLLTNPLIFPGAVTRKKSSLIWSGEALKYLLNRCQKWGISFPKLDFQWIKCEGVPCGDSENEVHNGVFLTHRCGGHSVSQERTWESGACEPIQNLKSPCNFSTAFGQENNKEQYYKINLSHLQINTMNISLKLPGLPHSGICPDTILIPSPSYVENATVTLQWALFSVLVLHALVPEWNIQFIWFCLYLDCLCKLWFAHWRAGCYEITLGHKGHSFFFSQSFIRLLQGTVHAQKARAFASCTHTPWECRQIVMLTGITNVYNWLRPKIKCQSQINISLLIATTRTPLSPSKGSQDCMINLLSKGFFFSSMRVMSATYFNIWMQLIYVFL